MTNYKGYTIEKGTIDYYGRQTYNVYDKNGCLKLAPVTLTSQKEAKQFINDLQ